MCSDMIIQVEDKREGVSVEVNNTPTVEVSSRAAERSTVEAKAESGTGVPIVEGRVSLCSALSARCVEKVDILSFLSSDIHKEAVMMIRATTDPDRRRELKKRLPAVTPAGVFSPQRRSCYLQTFSAMLGVDVDGKDNPHVEDWSRETHHIGRELPSVVYAGLSVGGNGCFVLFRITEPCRYGEHYAEITADLARFGFKVDMACRDLTRLRFASYDPAPYLNREATPHRLPAEPQPSPCNDAKEAISQPQRMTTEQLPTSTGGTKKRGDLQHLYSRIERAVATMVERGINIAEKYNDWFSIGCALASTYNERGRWLYHAISAQSSKYRRAECDEQYNRCMRSHGIGIGTLLAHLKRAGVRW